MMNVTERPSQFLHGQKEPTNRLTVNTPSPLYKKLKLAALNENKTICQVVIKLVNEYVSKSANK